jgi:serine/threonine protein kinase
MLRGRFDSAPPSTTSQTTSADSNKSGLLFPVPRSFLLGVAADVARALASLHSLHIAHGDVYAHNVLVKKGKNGPLPALVSEEGEEEGENEGKEGKEGRDTDGDGDGDGDGDDDGLRPVFAQLYDFGAAFFYPKEVKR